MAPKSIQKHPKSRFRTVNRTAETDSGSTLETIVRNVKHECRAVDPAWHALWAPDERSSYIRGMVKIKSIGGDGVSPEVWHVTRNNAATRCALAPSSATRFSSGPNSGW